MIGKPARTTRVGRITILIHVHQQETKRCFWHFITQEKRRREAGQRHWEKWAATKKASAGLGGADGTRGNDLGQPLERDREWEYSNRRRKAQDEAFEAWAKQKDRALRAKRREVIFLSCKMCNQRLMRV